jgi:hypothetical protein
LVNLLAQVRHLCLERKNFFMNTGIRRFILRLAIGLLAFLIGVSAAWAFGGFNPFQSSSGERYYHYLSHGSYRGMDVQPETADMPTVYRKRDRCRARGVLGELPPAPASPSLPYADAPMPPSPPASR